MTYCCTNMFYTSELHAQLHQTKWPNRPSNVIYNIQTFHPREQHVDVSIYSRNHLKMFAVKLDGFYSAINNVASHSAVVVHTCRTKQIHTTYDLPQNTQGHRQRHHICTSTKHYTNTSRPSRTMHLYLIININKVIYKLSSENSLVFLSFLRLHFAVYTNTCICLERAACAPCNDSTAIINFRNVLIALRWCAHGASHNRFAIASYGKIKIPY